MWSETRRSEFPVWPDCQVHQEKEGKSVLDRGLVIYVKYNEKCFGSLCFREHPCYFSRIHWAWKSKKLKQRTRHAAFSFKIMVPCGRFRLFCLQPHCLLTSYTSKPQEVVFCGKIFGWGSSWVFLSTGSTSLDGPGSLVHLGSLKCIHPQGGGDNVGEGTKLLIHGGCSESR